MYSKLQILNSFLHKTGFSLERYNLTTNAALRRNEVFKKYYISLLMDVGANTGIYGKEIRQAGYKGKIISFEPLFDAFNKLKTVAEKDKNWETNNYALGAENAEQEINISHNSHSSSILDILETHTNAEATASYKGKQKIQIKTLDSIFKNLHENNREIFLKIDTQGYELNVLKGAEQSLEYINTIQLEMSLQPLYAGQALYDEIFKYLWNKGYKLIDIEPGFTNINTGTLLQFDGIFRKD